MERVNCGNHFTEDGFNAFCKVLESEGEAGVYIDCTGHILNNYEQEAYKRHLLAKYGDSIVVERNEGLCSYHYDYKLKEVG